MYICNYCNYETHDKSGLSHHKKTKKHILNKETHEKKLKEEKENEIVKLKDKEIEELKQELIKVKEEKKELEVTAKIYKELSEKPKNVNNGIIINNNLSYVNKHFKNAPPLRKISNYVLNGIDLEDDTQIDKLTENIIYSYNNKCLHKLIGDHIIKIYKKDDLKLQSFHTTDVSRRKYLVKVDDKNAYLYDESSDEIDYYNPVKENNSDTETDSDKEYNELEKEYKKEQREKLLIKNKSKWTNDNDGIKVSYLVFDPLIKKIIRQLKKKCKEYNDEMENNKNKIPTKEETERFEVLSAMLKDIDKDKLRKNINNYISPYFYLIRK